MVDFIRRGTKKSLLAMLKKAKAIDNRLLSRLFEAVMFKEEYEEYSAGSAGFVKTDGTTPLTANWDAGAYEIRAKTLESDVATGTAPLTVASTTKVTNLNADLVDGVEEASFAYRNGTRTFTGDITIVDGTDPALFLRESGSATNYTKIYDDGVDLFNIVKYTPSSSANLFFSPIPSDGSSDAVMALFYNTSTTGSRVLNVYDGSAGQNVQHQLNAGTGDVDLCQQAGQVTIGGTAGAEKLTVTGDASVSTDLSVDTVNEYTGDAGVTIDSVLVKDNAVRCGDATNNITINNDYGVLLNGTTTVWEDLRVSVNAVRVIAGGAPPDWSQFKDNGAASTGVYLYWFDPGTEQNGYFDVQLPHGWKEGTDIKPHVHWVSADTAGVSGTDVCWGLEYTWANINGTFGNTTIIYGDEQNNGSGETITVDKHYYTDLGTISGSGKTISSMLVCRLFRDATGVGGTDDYDDDAGLLEIDFHYQTDTIGSRTETAK